MLFKKVRIKMHRTIILLVLHGCETCPLTLRKEEMVECLRTGCLEEYLDLNKDEQCGKRDMWCK
jgi:hypothetical protein